MSKMSRDKGKRFECAVAAQLRELWPGASVHRSSQADRAYRPDVVIDGSAAPHLAQRLWLELNDARDPRPVAKLLQAEEDVAAQEVRGDDAVIIRGSWLPVVVWHRTGVRHVATKATMRLGTLIVLSGGEGEDGEESSWRYIGTNLVVTCEWEALLAMAWTAPPRTPAASGLGGILDERVTRKPLARAVPGGRSAEDPEDLP